MAIYRKVYYHKGTGQVIKSQAYEQEGFVETTLVEDYHSIKELNDYYLDVIGMLELRTDNYDEDFRLCGNNIQVDLVTKELMFNRPTEDGGIAPSKKGLLEEIEDLKKEQTSTNLTLLELMESLFTL